MMILVGSGQCLCRIERVGFRITADASAGSSRRRDVCHGKRGRLSHDDAAAAAAAAADATNAADDDAASIQRRIIL